MENQEKLSEELGTAHLALWRVANLAQIAQIYAKHMVVVGKQPRDPMEESQAWDAISDQLDAIWKDANSTAIGISERI